MLRLVVVLASLPVAWGSRRFYHTVEQPLSTVWSVERLTRLHVAFIRVPREDCACSLGGLSRCRMRLFLVCGGSLVALC